MASQDTTHSAHQIESPAGETTHQQSPTAPETSGSETNTSPICLALSTRTGTPSSHKLPRRTKPRSHLLQTPTFLGILFREQLPKDSSTLQMSSQRSDWRERLHANPSKRGNNVGPRSFWDPRKERFFWGPAGNSLRRFPSLPYVCTWI